VKVNFKVVLAAGLAVLVASPVSADNSGQAPPPANRTNTPDPTEIVCQKVEVLGSRLAVKKVCMTRSQWEDSRRQDRQAVEKAQASPCVIQPTGHC
jgi:predicted secreted protein